MVMLQSSIFVLKTQGFRNINIYMSINYNIRDSWQDDDGAYRSSDVSTGYSQNSTEHSAAEGLNPSSSRLRVAGLQPGGSAAPPQRKPNVWFASRSAGEVSGSTVDSDWRVRLSLADSNTVLYNSVNNNDFLAPLKRTRGVIWPYVPSITVSHNAEYSSAGLTHSNYAQQFYNRSEVGQIIITGDFTVQNIREGQYVLAVVMFLRAATKMFYGNEPNAGQPPPILFLDGFGQHYFPHVPVVIQSFQHQLSDDVDFLEIPLHSGSNTTNPAVAKKLPGADLVGTNRVPVRSTITVTLVPVYSRSKIHREFTVDAFASGKFMASNGGGFL
jgi:hypothetical protein